MKKNRLLFLLPLLAAFALTSCDQLLSNLNFNGPRKRSSEEDSEVLDDSDDYGNSSSKRSSSKSSSSSSSSSYHRHTWGEWVVVRPATCYEEGLEQRECSICHATQTASIARIDHQWGEWEVAHQVTCYEDGIRYRTCQICGDRVEEYIPATGHTWGEPVTLQTATCTSDGLSRRTCSRCKYQETIVVPALGHNYDYNNVNWTVAPSCVQVGVGTVTCTRCGEQIEITNQASNHSKTLIDYHSPQSGKADVRVYRCMEGCNVTYLGFSVRQVSATSASHLTYEYDDTGINGARFWGRPIGNDVPLTENGDANSDNHEPIFNENQMGDYFEIVFDLTANQVSALGEECALYCDATPAPYMYQSNLDFWARRPSDEDWTPGYYIDDNPDTEENEIGQQIADYRYALYVDGVLRAFDPTMEVPVLKNNARSEYVLPYIFRLHAGTNSFRLHMAGGYRSIFHNFTFRPYVAPTQITVNRDELSLHEEETFQLVSPFDGLTFKSANTKVATVSATGLVTAVAEGQTTITVSKEGNYKSVKIPVNVTPPEGVISLALADGVIAPEDGIEIYNSSSSGQWYRNMRQDATLTFTFQSELAGKYAIKLGLRGGSVVLDQNIAIKVNDVDVTVTGTVNTSYTATEYVVGQADLKVGENTMVITALTYSSLYFKTIRLIPIV